MDNSEPYEIPTSIIESELPLLFMKQFMEAHQYKKDSIWIRSLE